VEISPLQRVGWMGMYLHRLGDVGACWAVSFWERGWRCEEEEQMREELRGESGSESEKAGKWIVWISYAVCGCDSEFSK